MIREPITTMSTGHLATAQAGQLVSIADCREHKMTETTFLDNLDYLQALEREGQLILVQALLRQRGADWQANPHYVQAMSAAEISPAECSPEKLAEQIARTELQNHQGADAAEQKGVEIYFIQFCRENKIEGFNRKLILLLLLLATNEAFAKMFDLCDFGDKVRDGSKIKIGTILNILCGDYRQQLVNRKYLSLESHLIRQDILFVEKDTGEPGSICESYVSINDRYARYFIGDNNLYKSTSALIQRDTGCVQLAQVIIPQETKDEIVSRVSDYLALRNISESDMLDEFFGYGTALTILFHGPSGTGKTMMAQALASHFSRPIYSLKMSDFNIDRFAKLDDAIKELFLEASLNAGIVYFDEADDFFEKDSYLSRLLLIEIEKARCVVILSTNQPVNLDPAMDRRLSLKIYFSIPNAELRYKIWQALMPDFAKLTNDVDFKALAERYNFTGGLIKNSIYMTLTSSLTSGRKNKTLVTMAMIEHACKLQLHQMCDMSDLYQIYEPEYRCSEVHLNRDQKIDLTNVANIYRTLQKKASGLNILVTSNDIQSGVKVVEALACECNLKIKRVSYTDLLGKCFNTEQRKILDPLTQTIKTPLEIAFAERTGDATLLMFVDYYGETKWTEEAASWNGIERGMFYYSLLHHMESYKGLFCMVTLPAVQKIPRQFNLHFNLEYPPLETQMEQWEKHLYTSESDDELLMLVENNPLHLAEIDYYAKQAFIQSLIEGKTNTPSLQTIKLVIERHRGGNKTPVLFGRID